MGMEIGIGIESHPFFLTHLVLAIHLFSFLYLTPCIPIRKRHLSGCKNRTQRGSGVDGDGVSDSSGALRSVQRSTRPLIASFVALPACPRGFTYVVLAVYPWTNSHSHARMAVSQSATD